MSLTGNLNASPYSLTGINNFNGTVNGLVPVSVINIAGQILFLSWDSTTSTLTLLIPTSNGVVALGLLSATDWNTFNNKENVLTFTSPLRRIGNTIDFDFSIPNTFTGVNTFTNNTNFNNNIYLNALTLATTPNVLYIDGTGLVSYGASPNLLPLNNIWTGTNTFNNLVRVSDVLIVENVSNTGLVMTIFRDKTNFPADYLFFNNSGDLGFTSSVYNGWSIDRNGDTRFKSIEVTGGGVAPLIVYRDKINYPFDYFSYDIFGKLGHNTPTDVWVILPEGDADFTTLRLRSRTGFVGNVFKCIRDVSVPNDFIYFDNVGTFGYNSGWNIQSAGVMTMPVVQTTYIQCTNNTFRNFFKFSHFEPSSPTFSNWISAEFSYDGVDKPVIGNLGLAVGGYGACYGGHDTTLGAWRDCWINPFATTYTGNLNATAFNYPSDRRIKKEISYLDASKSIKFVKGLKPAKFKKCVDDRIEFLKNEGEKFELGFIAQDIQEIAETESQKMIVTTETYLEKERLTIKPFYILAELVNANKEMIDKIERLETENKTLLERLEANKEMIDKIEMLETQNKTLLERLEAIELKLKRNYTILKY